MKRLLGFSLVFPLVSTMLQEDFLSVLPLHMVAIVLVSFFVGLILLCDTEEKEN